MADDARDESGEDLGSLFQVNIVAQETDQLGLPKQTGRRGDHVDGCRERAGRRLPIGYRPPEHHDRIGGSPAPLLDLAHATQFS
ncbi:hypothetical protein [Nostocoides australiense]